MISDAQRRTRLVARHGLGTPFDSIISATEAMVAWHATDNSTVYLSIGARVSGATPANIDAALYDDRSIVKQMAMRRTIFAFPRATLPAAISASGQRVAEQERRKTIKELTVGGTADAAAWLAGVEDLAVDALRAEPLTSTQLRQKVPETDCRIHVAPGTKWGGEQPLAPRLLTILSAAGRVVRGSNDTHWRTSKPRWVAMDTWLGEAPELMDPAEGYRTPVTQWLRAFGPGTETDLVWWFGATKGAIRQALAEIVAVEVDLEHGGTGWLLPDDLDDVTPVEPGAALLPVLDPTTMGWKERGFYLGPHADHLVDRAGNVGNTAWWDGRIVGGWVQTRVGEIELQLLEPVSDEARSALSRKAEQLATWLGGVRISTYFPSPLMQSSAGR